MPIYDEQIRGKVEGFLSALAASLMAIGAICGFLIPLLEDSPPHSTGFRLFFGFMLLLAIPTEAWLVTMMWHGIYWKRQPLAPLIAAAQPRLPRVLRPVIAVWWLLHLLFCSGILIAVVFGMEVDSWEAIVGMILLNWGISYLVYIYLLLTVTAITRNYNVILWLWKFRARWALLTSLLIIAVEIVRSSWK